jgi:hypothetical protein
LNQPVHETAPLCCWRGLYLQSCSSA